MSGTNVMFLGWAILVLLPSAGLAAEDPEFDAQLAAKYGLHVPPLPQQVEPAPQWLRQAEMVSSSAAVWTGYEFRLEATPSTRIVRARAGYRKVEMPNYALVETVAGIDAESVRGVPLLSHVPHSAEAFRLAHEHGIKAIPYVHFMCIHTDYLDQDVAYFEHPEILMKDAQGHWVHTGMDGSDRLHRFRTCANSPSYWQLSLVYVKKLMDWGADGVFIDNAGRRPACCGPDFNRVRNPEFEPYVHEHLFPHATHDEAWERFLHAVRAVVKSYGDDKVVVLNSSLGDPWQTVGDCAMWESFIFSWAWEGRRHTWNDVKKKAQANRWYLDAGRRIVALAFLDPQRHDMHADPYWAFACARLVDFILWSNLDHTEAERLYRANLGRGLEPCQEADGIAHRFFENGLIVLNDSAQPREVALPVAAGFSPTRLWDLSDAGQTLPVDEGRVRVSVAGQTARILVSREVP